MQHFHGKGNSYLGCTGKSQDRDFVSPCNDSQLKEQSPTLSKVRNFEGHKLILDVKRSLTMLQDALIKLV